VNISNYLAISKKSVLKELAPIKRLIAIKTTEILLMILVFMSGLLFF
jgi:hypothetical protein